MAYYQSLKSFTSRPLYVFDREHLRFNVHNLMTSDTLTLFDCCSVVRHNIIIPPHNEVVGGGYIGFTPSVRPSVRPVSVPHPVSGGGGGGGGGILVSLRPSVRPSVPCPSRIPCPLCSFYSSGWIHFIFIHLIKQLQRVCRVLSFLQNFKIWNVGNFF